MSSLQPKLCTLWFAKLVLGATLLLSILLYIGSLLGDSNNLDLKQEQQQSSGTAKNLLPNRVAISLRSELPATGVSICPSNFSEYIPCHDPGFISSVARLNVSRREHLERHCPPAQARPFCLIPPPSSYKIPIRWPMSRDFVWRSNVNHTRLAEVKGGQNWVHVNASRMWFPGGGTHFKHGAPEYIQRLGNMTTNSTGDLRSAGVAQVLDVGCGVASFAAYLFPLDIQTMSFAPLDGHENQIQFALERGIPAMIGVLGTKRLPYPSKSFDAIHCSRCRVDWHEDGGILLREADRLLRPGGFFIYSAPPVYRKDKDFPEIWSMVTNITSSICWKLIAKQVQTAVWQKTADRACQIRHKTAAKLCSQEIDLDASWNKPLVDCIGLTAEADSSKNIRLPPWPARLTTYSKIFAGAGLKSAAEFEGDTSAWDRRIREYWRMIQLPEDDDSIRNIMDMNAGYGGFAAALALHGKPAVWVMNVVPSEFKNTLGVIYGRGLIGTFHSWCEAFSSYPRSYDLLHADQLLSAYKDLGSTGCGIANLMLEMDRLLRPNGFAIFRDTPAVVEEVIRTASKFIWEVMAHTSNDGDEQQVLICRKKFWILEP